MNQTQLGLWLWYSLKHNIWDISHRTHHLLSSQHLMFLLQSDLGWTYEAKLVNMKLCTFITVTLQEWSFRHYFLLSSQLLHITSFGSSTSMPVNTSILMWIEIISVAGILSHKDLVGRTCRVDPGACKGKYHLPIRKSSKITSSLFLSTLCKMSGYSKHSSGIVCKSIVMFFLPGSQSRHPTTACVVAGSFRWPPWP